MNLEITPSVLILHYVGLAPRRKRERERAREGILRDKYLIKGKFRDMATYSILKMEYQ